MDNPANYGSYQYKKIIYASNESKYKFDSDHTPTECGHINVRKEYSYTFVANGPFVTNTVNLEDFLENLSPEVKNIVDFETNKVPLNGFMFLPESEGPMPLILIVHGCGSYKKNAASGFIYLCKQLASHGIIAVSIDQNFLYSKLENVNEILSRAIVILEHLKLFHNWNKTIGHPMYQRIDCNKIMLVGHSRGGEAITVANYLNQSKNVPLPDIGMPVSLEGDENELGPYRFNLQALVAIAPTDIIGTIPVGSNYFLLQGSRDADVDNFGGCRTYEKVNPVLGQSKAQIWIQKANHNYFNTRWDRDLEGDITLRALKQQGITKLYIALIAKIYLLDKNEYLPMLQNHKEIYKHKWLSSQILLITQYQSARNLVIQDFEEVGAKIRLSASVQGEIEHSFPPGHINKIEFNPGKNRGISLFWSSREHHYSIKLNQEGYRINFEKGVLSFNIAQSIEKYDLFSKRVKDYTLIIESSNPEASCSFSSRDLHRLLVPDTIDGETVRTVLQSVRIPFEILKQKGTDPAKIKLIKIQFDQQDIGRAYLSKIQFSQ